MFSETGTSFVLVYSLDLVTRAIHRKLFSSVRWSERERERERERRERERESCVCLPAM